VLSRCLQFTLQQLTHDEILGQLKFIMDAEKLTYEESALSQIAEFGNGSMRDALSLLDQSISYGNGSVTSQDIKAMLGLVHHDDIISLAQHLFNQDAKAVIARDMSLAPSEQIGFEMTLLRMLAFHSDVDSLKNTEKKTLKITPKATPSIQATKKLLAEKPHTQAPTQKTEQLQDAHSLTISNQQEWEEISQTIKFTGGAKMLVRNTLFDTLANNTLTLTLDKQFTNLLSDQVHKSILGSLRVQYAELNLVINLDQLDAETLAQKESKAHKLHLDKIQQTFLNDEIVQQLEQTFNAKVDVKSIKEITRH